MGTHRDELSREEYETDPRHGAHVCAVSARRGGDINLVYAVAMRDESIELQLR